MSRPLIRRRSDRYDELRALAAREPENRAHLAEARAGASYETAWEEPNPLVTVTVATIGRTELIERALPSLLVQSHERMQIVVAGDGCPPGLAERLGALGDERLLYLDLGPSQPVFSDPVKNWRVGATRARNAATAEARGSWIVEFDDDDSMRPDGIAALLATARERRAEVAYGKVSVATRRGPRLVGTFPPRQGQLSWIAGIYHAGLAFFGREFAAADLGLPGDWWLAERMLRSGVRFAMRDEIIADAYPSSRKPGRLRRLRG